MARAEAKLSLTIGLIYRENNVIGIVRHSLGNLIMDNMVYVSIHVKAVPSILILFLFSPHAPTVRLLLALS
jgi:hypothetical protein